MELSEAQTVVSLFPDPFPAPWAREWGEDEFGLWMALVFRGVRQVFRWMAPGTFSMGSPASEPERWAERETLHQVTLNRGFWLADSACTQALWQAVMGNNPSRFSGSEPVYLTDDRGNRLTDDQGNPLVAAETHETGGCDSHPVERVSWNDVQAFCARLNAPIPGLKARLPAEAQWEYACRAGTTTPFSFGGNITPDEVNYDGNYPYAGGRKGLYRQTTVPVKSLPPNPWGLYEMHGNVLEWCADGYGGYPESAQVDPMGPADGADRVVRGGAWSGNARHCRSAYRGASRPDFSADDIGFRLALG